MNVPVWCLLVQLLFVFTSLEATTDAARRNQNRLKSRQKINLHWLYGQLGKRSGDSSFAKDGDFQLHEARERLPYEGSYDPAEKNQPTELEEQHSVPFEHARRNSSIFKLCLGLSYPDTWKCKMIDLIVMEKIQAMLQKREMYLV
ncbi:uncharacterized protein [Ptychodera flava]|uniref:uncharacterized protein n=1 Tax=Ptychodera flava TaxID=63121 RepID=UPI00396A3549